MILIWACPSPQTTLEARVGLEFILSSSKDHSLFFAEKAKKELKQWLNPSRGPSAKRSPIVFDNQ
jgi:hypothetical protein